jgi:anti-anti-sigma regulatory factor
LTLVEAIVLQQKVLALIARRPAAIVLDVAGLMPIDEMGVLMLSAVAGDAAGYGITVALANPSARLRDRLAQLGVHNLTFIIRPAETAPTEDAYEQEAGSRRVSLPPLGPEEATGADEVRAPIAPSGVGIHEVALPGSLSPFCSTS